MRDEKRAKTLGSWGGGDKKKKTLHTDRSWVLLVCVFKAESLIQSRILRFPK